MFETACLLYHSVLCVMGGHSTTRGLTRAGTACLLSPDHALTALHVINDIRTAGLTPFISKHDGVFKCEVMCSSEYWDTAVVKATERIELAQRQAPAQYPVVSERQPTQGMTVGYMAWLNKPAPNGRTFFRYFSVAHVAYKGCAVNGNDRWIMSGGFIEPGFSGCPAFLPDGTLVGVIAGNTGMTQNHTLPGIIPIPYCVPEVSKLLSLGDTQADIDRSLASV